MTLDDTLITNHAYVGSELLRIFKITRGGHPDDDCAEVGLPWKDDGVNPPDGQYNLGLLTLTLRRIRLWCMKKSKVKWSEFQDNGRHLMVHMRDGDEKSACALTDLCASIAQEVS